MAIKNITLSIYKLLKRIAGGRGFDKFAPINYLNQFILSKLKSEYAFINGHKMLLDSQDSLNLSVFGNYEEFETELFKSIVQEGDVIVDVGANIGYYTLLFAQKVGNSGKVYAIEPDPNNFKILKKNIEINDYNNVIPINKAVSDNLKPLKLYLSEDNKGDHRCYDSGDNRNFFEVETLILDQALKEVANNINLIKMDIQGFELTALKSMENILRNNQKVKLITEFWPYGLELAGTNGKEILDLLKDYGFEISNIDDKSKRIIPIQNESEILNKYQAHRKNFTNLYCVKPLQ